MPNKPWQEGDNVGPVLTSLLKGETDIGGTAAVLTTSRINVGKTVSPDLKIR